MATNKDLKWEVTSKPEWVDVTPITGQGDTQVNVTIHEDVDPSSGEEGYITVTCTSCKTQKQQQIRVCRCACNCDRLNITWNADTIGQSGMASGAIIGAYTINGGCAEDKISAKIKNNKTGVETDLSLSNGNVKTTSKISANTTPDTIQYDVTVGIVNGDSCTNFSHSMTQEGIVCDCGKVLSSVTFNDIPKNGVAAGSQVGTYRLRSDYQCPTDTLSATLSGDDGTQYTLTMSGNKLKLPSNKGISANTEPNSKTFRYVVSYSGNECSASTKTQPGTGCGCGKLTDVDLDRIPTTGVTANTQIGTFTVDSDCMSDFSFTSTTLQLTTNGNKIITTQDIPSTSKPTGETYIIKANFMGEPCEGEYTLNQDGLDCSCASITEIKYLPVLKNHIPQTGLTANTPVLTYALKDGCSDSNLNVTFSYIGASQNLTLRNGTGYLSQRIGEAGGLRYINSSVSYSGSSCSQWDDTFIQEGAACTCDSIRLSTDDASHYARLPYAGTHGEWVVVASGDTGLYDTNDNLIDVCGSLSGVCTSEYLEEDENHNKVVVEAVAPSPGFSMSNIYLFKVNVKGIENPPSAGDYTLTINLYFKDKDGNVTQCVNRNCSFVLTNNACDCNKTPSLIVHNVPCDGTSGFFNLASIGKSSIPTNMTLIADAPDPETSLVTDFEASTSSSGFFLSGKVNERNDTGEERVIGTSRVYYYCNKGEVTEWYCGYDDVDFIQSPCESCNCEEINDMIKKDISTYMSYSSNTKTFDITSYATNKACLTVYIPGQDESGVYTGEWVDSGGNPAGTFTAQITERVTYYGRYYQLAVTMPSDDTHKDRTASVPIVGRYKPNDGDEWVDCETYYVTLNDEACDCTTASAAISRYMTGSTGGIPNSAVTFDKGSTLEYLGFINFGGEKDETCIRLCIFDAPNLTGCTKAEKYVDPNEYFEAYGETYLNQGRIFFNLLKDLDSDKLVWFAPSYMNNGEWKPCGQYWQVRLHQEKCTCDEFKSNVTVYTDPFVHSQTGSLTDLKVAHIYNTCGCGRLYVFDNQGNGYAAENINNLPDELQYIKGMTEGCFGNSYDRPGQPDGYLTVEPLTKEQAEQLPDKKRITHMGVCWCDGCDSNADTKLNENDVCECMVEFDVTETYQTDCSKYRCSDYDLNLNNSCQSSSCRISHAGNEGSPMLIGTYDQPIECFSAEVTCEDTSVKSCTTGVTASGKVGIYIECYPNTGEEDIIIDVDINVTKEGSSDTCQHGNIKVTLEHP